MKVTFVAFDGASTLVEAEEGQSLMQAAIASDVDGILGECGGSMMCATCHCYVDEGWADRAGPRVDGEDDMLECATSEVRATSRLSCQIRMSARIDGIVLHLPKTQV